MTDEMRLLRFLLVEDDDQHAKLIKRNLEGNRIRNSLDRVADGEAALRYLRRQGEHAGIELPDVILLDLKLPRIDGHEVLRQIKDDPLLRQIPVVVLSTSSAESDRAKAYGSHANSYLVKPLDFDRFKTMVDDLSFYWGVWNQRSRDFSGSY